MKTLPSRLSEDVPPAGGHNATPEQQRAAQERVDADSSILRHNKIVGGLYEQELKKVKAVVRGEAQQ